LLGRQDLFEDIAERHLAPGALGFDVAEDALQIAHAGRQRLHFADALMHFRERIIDHLERRAEPLLQCALELFVDRLTHLLQLFGVLEAQHIEAPLDRPAKLGHRRAELLRHLLEA
jgi:hypothetical protein